MDYTNGKIYKITNLIDGKIYIGRTKHSLKERFRQHVKNKRGKTFIGSAITKYGFENFTIERIEDVFTIEQAMEREKYWIKELNSQNREIGYNLTEGGDDKRIVTKALIKNRNYYIKCNETGETFETMVDVASAFDVSETTISSCVRNNKKLKATYTFSKTSKDGNQLTGPLNIKRETRFAGFRRIKCIQTGEIFQSVGSLAAKINIKYPALRRIIKKGLMCDGLSYEFIDGAAKRNTINGSKKISKPVKCVESGELFSSVASLGKKLGVTSTYAYFIMNKMGGIHKGLHYIFL